MSKGASPPRAREKKASHTEQARRVDVITSMMQHGHWEPGLAEKLALEWGVSESMVRQLSAEASRRHEFVLSLVGDPTKLADEAAAMLVRTMHRSYEKNNADGVIRAADVVTKIKGGRVAEKSELTITAKELELLPPPALLARLDAQLAKLAAARAALLDEHPELVPVREALGLGPIPSCPHVPKHFSGAACALGVAATTLTEGEKP